MKDRLIKLLGIEPGEESMITLLLTQSVFLGIFFGAFDISAHSFFLSVFDEKMMARGYVLSGLAGIILTSSYTYFQTTIRFRNFSVVNLGFVTILTLLLWFLLLVSPAYWVIWLVFIMLGPLNILAMLGFWGTVSRLFTLRQGKRLFGLIDAGLIVGIIISCYAIPVLLSLNFKPHNILLISTAALFIASIIQFRIGSSFTFSHGEGVTDDGKSTRQRSFFAVVRHDPYIRTMALFIALSVVTAFFVQYSFMAVTREQYPSEDDMARFLGLFTGSMMIITLLIKLLVFSYLIKNYGLRTCLALSPVLIALLSLIAVIIGIIKGFTPAAGIGFMLFFMLLALSRLFSKSLKDSIESPSFKVIYQTIDEKVRYEVQSGMDGTVNEIAALSSGLILAGLGILSFVRLIHFSIVLVFISVLWIFVAFRLYAGYRNSIRKALEAGGDNIPDPKVSASESNFSNKFYSGLALKNDYFRLINGDYENLKPGCACYLSSLPVLAVSGKDINLLPAMKKMASDMNLDPGLRVKAEKAAESLSLLLQGLQEKDDRYFNARQLLAGSRMPQTTQILRLMRETSAEAKLLAMYMIGKFRIKDMLPEVMECLNISGLENQAESVLRYFGPEADEALRHYYLVSSGNINVSKTILRLLGRNCSSENRNFMFSRLWSGSRQIREIALRELVACGFTPSTDEKDRLHQLISDIVGIMVWNLSARISLEREHDTVLSDPLDREIARWNSFLFGILSVTYDAGSIGRIRENLENGTVESVNYALEMIDMVIDESIKPKIIPLLDVIPAEDKVRHLYQFFPGEIPAFDKLMVDMINRDYNLLGIWIRACALRNLKEITTKELGESLVALLFSPERILQEESAGLLFRAGKEIYSEARARIPADIRTWLNKIASGEVSHGELTFEKVRFLKSCFTDTDEEDLLPITGSAIFKVKLTNETLPVNGGYLYLPEKIEDAGVFYTAQEMKDPAQDRQTSEFFHILPLKAVEEFCSNFPEKAADILNFIEKHGK